MQNRINHEDSKSKEGQIKGGRTYYLIALLVITCLSSCPSCSVAASWLFVILKYFQIQNRINNKNLNCKKGQIKSIYCLIALLFCLSSFVFFVQHSGFVIVYIFKLFQIKSRINHEDSKSKEGQIKGIYYIIILSFVLVCYFKMFPNTKPNRPRILEEQRRLDKEHLLFNSLVVLLVFLRVLRAAQRLRGRLYF